MEFSNFTTEDFLQHTSFRQWVLEDDADGKKFWEEWLKNNPDKRHVAADAREMLLLIGGGRAHTPAPQDQQETWQKVLQTIAATGESTRMVKLPATNRNIRLWWSYAAIFAGILILTYVTFVFYGRDNKQIVSTSWEQQTITLPDHSIVKLNVNSTLRYSHEWNNSGPREVWLSGEGYFSIQHQTGNRKFIVHTSDVDIQVVGTAFNVNTRRVQTQVVLDNGIVKLKLNAAPASSVEKQEPITMKPGEMITYSVTTRQLISKKVNPEEYASWRNRVLQYNETPISEVISSLQDNLGVNIQLKDERIGQQTFTGTIPIDNLSMFFRTLERSFNVHIEQTGTGKYVIQ
jgi:ferric-dicitrate binding protein FerR (iron transport regulator)